MNEVIEYCKQRTMKAKEALRSALKEFKNWKACVEHLELQAKKKAERRNNGGEVENQVEETAQSPRE